MSFKYILLFFSVVGCLKIPKRGEEFERPNEGELNSEPDSSSSDDNVQVRINFAEDDEPLDGLLPDDPEILDDPAIPGPSNRRVFHRRSIGVPIPMIRNPAVPGTSYGLHYRTVRVPIPSLFTPRSHSSSSSTSDEVFEAAILNMPLPMVNLLSDMSMSSTTSDSVVDGLVDDALSNENTNEAEKMPAGNNRDEQVVPSVSVSPDEDPIDLATFDESIMDLISSLSTLTSSTSDSADQEPTSTTNFLEPPVLHTSQGPIEIVENHFGDKEATPAVPTIVITPPDNSDEHLDSSSDVLNVTSSTNVTSGYQSTSANNSAAFDHSVSVDTTVNSSDEEFENVESIAIDKTYISLNMAYSPFERLREIVQREKRLIDQNSFLRWIMNTGNQKHEFKNKNLRHVINGTKDPDHKEIGTEAKNENEKVLKLKSTIRVRAKNVTADSEDQNADTPELFNRAHIPEELCSESVESIAQKLQIVDTDIERPIWHTNSGDDQNSKREELRISEVTSEGTINLDRQIEEWVSLEGHAVGRGDHGLTLVISNPQGFQVDHIEMDSHITSMCIFQWWNSETSAKSIGLVIAQDATIYWYELQDNHLIQLWSWVLTEPITAMKIFQIEGKWKLAVSFEQSYGGNCAIAIYGLELWQSYWFEQRLNGCESLTLANEGRYIMAVHNDMATVFIYRYNQEERFYVNIQNVSSPGVRHISTFTAGPYSFLAIGGDNSVIYQLRGNQMIKQTIRDYLLDHVEVWLPINIGYYRNDVILLVQHRLHHDSHHSVAIEALRWDEQEFSLMEHAPCRSHGDEMYGFICMTDAENERGILGGTVFRNSYGKTFIILATHEFTPSMFEIRTEIVELMDPVEEKLSLVHEYAQTLKQRLIDQFKVVEEVKKINKKRNDEGDSGLVNADNLKIKELIAPVIRLHGNLKDYLKVNGDIEIAGKNMNHLDLELDVTTLFEKIKTNSVRINKLKQRIEKAAKMKGGIPKTLRYVKMKGRIFTKGKTLIKNANIETINNLNADSVLINALEKPKDGKLLIRGKSTVKHLQTDNVDAQIVNGFDMIDPTNNHGPLDIYGDLTMVNHVKILHDVNLSEKMNNIDVKNDIFVPGKEFATNDPLRFENLKVNHLFVDHVNDFPFTEAGLKDLIENSPSRNVNRDFFNEVSVNRLTVGKDLHFQTINGLPWKDLMNRIVMKTENNEIDFLRVDGKITVDNKLKMDYLNTLLFPQDYFMVNEPSAIQVTGAKTFDSKLFVAEVDCDGTVNGIPHNNIVTLSTNQNLNNFTFYDLTVTERMTVDGEITGKELDAFLSNPLLTETKHIKSNVIFKNLVVNGNVMVEETINGTHWQEIFSDVVQKSDEQLTIDSTKIFKGLVTAKNGIKVQSGFMNDKKIKDLLTVDTEQDTFIQNIKGNVWFENINVGGTFDDVNITDLVKNSISLFENQSTNTQLIFDYDFSAMEAKTVEVTETFNNQRVGDIMSKSNLILNAPEFLSLHVDHLIVEGDIEKSWSISGINLNDFEQTRLSKTKHQEITAPYTIKNCNVNELYFKYLNDKVNDEIYTNLRKIADVENNIYNGNVAIRNLHVIGNLDVSFVNNLDVNRLIDEAVVLNRENIITSPVTFVDPVYLRTLQINGKSYDKNFDKFLRDVVQKSDKDVTFEGRKTFVNGMNVKGDVTTKYLNNIEHSKILTSNTEQRLIGTLIILGNLTSKSNIKINGFVNGVQMNDIAESFKYLGNDTYRFKGNVVFESGSEIHDLKVKGFVNEQYNLEDILNNAVYKDSDNNFTNQITFNNRVIFNDGLNVNELYNGIYVNRLINDLVFVSPNNDSNVINGVVVFQQPIDIKGSLTVDTNLEGKTIDDCNLEEWRTQAVYLNNQRLPTGPQHFDNSALENNINEGNNNEIPPGNFVQSVV